jgi:hypothetical protein
MITGLEPLHFSLLKELSKSPAHLAAALRAPRATTRGMRVSSGVHRLVLGERSGHKLVCFDGDRRQGKAWEAFAAEHAGEDVLTRPESDDAHAIAETVRADPLVRELLEGAQCEVPLSWEDSGFRCATRGVDILGPRWLADLKVTTNVEPERLQRHAEAMFWHAQLVWYQRGAAANRIDVKELYLVAVEASPPHVCTVLEMTEGMTELATKTLTRWTERLRQCVECETWPGYAMRPVPWVLRPGRDAEIDELDDEEEGAA